jgi:hypothetical protein
LFEQDDRDAVDDYAITLVALSMLGLRRPGRRRDPFMVSPAAGAARTAVAREYGASHDWRDLIRLAVLGACDGRRRSSRVCRRNAPLFEQ